MGFAVLPALIPDIRQVYDVYFEAFQAENMGAIMLNLLFPRGVATPEFREGHTKATLNWWYHSTTQYTFKCVDTATGEIVGMALLDIFLRERNEEERENLGIVWLEGAERERAEKVVNPLHDMKEKLCGGRPHIYLHVMAVRPCYQGKRIGTVIVNWLKDLANQTGLPIYFESSPSSHGFYTKAGFETLNQKVVHAASVLGTNTDVEVPLMVKMPSGAGISFTEWSTRRNGVTQYNQQ